jgi:hypothetical protein
MARNSAVKYATHDIRVLVSRDFCAPPHEKRELRHKNSSRCFVRREKAFSLAWVFFSNFSLEFKEPKQDVGLLGHPAAPQRNANTAEKCHQNL